LNKFLVDVNVLVALGDKEHVHHPLATRWLKSINNARWGTCAVTQAGFLRIMTNPKLGGHSFGDANRAFASISSHPGYEYWPIERDWISLAAPFMERVWGHQQISDAWLLGLAISGAGILVTMDKAVLYMAGAENSAHVLVLE
jgi:uncharacterized protein